MYPNIFSAIFVGKIFEKSMVTLFFAEKYFSDHYDVNYFFCNVFPRLYSLFQKWTFINVQNRCPFSTFGKKKKKKVYGQKGTNMQPTTAKREQSMSREYCEHICSQLFQPMHILALDKITYQLRQF